MVETYLTVLLVALGSILVGRSVLLTCGRTKWVGIEPAIGFATMVALEGILARIPGQEFTLPLGLLALAAFGLYPLFRQGREALPSGRGFWIVSAVVLVLVSIPFLITGYWGLIGMGFNNDLGLHLAWAQSLTGDFGTEPSPGYPLGPHGLAAGLARLPLIEIGPVFIGMVMALPVILAMIGFEAVRALPGWRRVLAAILIGLPYLVASFFAQAAFKEVAMALFLLAFVVLISEVDSSRTGPWSRAQLVTSFAVLTLGIVFTFSFPGLVFPVAVALLWLVTGPRIRSGSRAIGRALKRPRVILGTIGVLALLSALAFWSPFGFGTGFSEVANSDTFGPVSPVEAFGVWLSPDYRLGSEVDAPVPFLLGAIGAIAVIASLIWWFRRPRSIYPWALLAVAIVYLLSLPLVGNYSLAKALAIGSPLVMVVVLSALLDRPFPSSRGRSIAWAGLATVFIVLASASSLLVLRDTAVAPSARADELAAFTDQVGGQDVLFGDQDRFAPYYLPFSNLGIPLPFFPDETVAPNLKKPFAGSFGESAIDFDSFSRGTLQRYRYVVTSSAAWQSANPPSFEEVDRTPSWILWRRTSPARFRSIMGEKAMAAKFAACTGPGDRYYSGLDGTATVMPETVIGEKEAWLPGSEVGAGGSASNTLPLGKGRWRLSIQYASPLPATLTAPAFERRLVASLNGQRLANFPIGSIGQFWPAGVVEVDGEGPVRFEFEVDPPSTLQRLTGYGRRASLGRIVATRVGTRERVPMSGICGRWVDFFQREAPVRPSETRGAKNRP